MDLPLAHLGRRELWLTSLSTYHLILSLISRLPWASTCVAPGNSLKARNMVLPLTWGCLHQAGLDRGGREKNPSGFLSLVPHLTYQVVWMQQTAGSMGIGRGYCNTGIKVILYTKHHCSVFKEIYQGKPFLGTLLRIQPNSTSQSPVLRTIFPLPPWGRATSSILRRVNLCSLSRTNLIPYEGNLWAFTVPRNTFPILGLFIKNVLWSIIQVGIWYFKYSSLWRSLHSVTMKVICPQILSSVF